MSPDPPSYRPTRAQQEAARGRSIPDVIAADLRVLFCGINPGLYSGATGYHFARPSSRRYGSESPTDPGDPVRGIRYDNITVW